MTASEIGNSRSNAALNLPDRLVEATVELGELIPEILTRATGVLSPALDFSMNRLEQVLKALAEGGDARLEGEDLLVKPRTGPLGLDLTVLEVSKNAQETFLKLVDPAAELCLEFGASLAEA